ncbi:unnamed protein product [Timema podura]|uniref:Multiple inositol polyphosphate phosphatase 1 n=1 Tax=Timema podura TaxID=61482 RepID=A0ABN7NI39_TIMPD|nr:unnamed protein product [Timema podura]
MASSTIFFLYVSDCEPAQIWILARHGTHYPKKKDIDDLRDLIQLRDQIVRNREDKHNLDMCYDDIDNLKHWHFDVQPDQHARLTNQGREEIRFLAQRYKTSYRSLLERPYSSEAYQFRYAEKDHAQESADAFARSLFGGNSGAIYFPSPPENDTLLMPNANCAKWRDEVEGNPEVLKEVKLFDEGPEMRALVHNVSTRLGFRYDLNTKQISMMYDMCSYNKAWKLNDVSPWCAAFSTEELKVLDFKEDLISYYQYSYGNEMNARLGCPAVSDLIQHFTRLESQSGQQPLGVFYFSHATVLQMVLSKLGIARDREPLTHSNYRLMQRRQWKTHSLVPFSSNLAAVFYRIVVVGIKTVTIHSLSECSCGVANVFNNAIVALLLVYKIFCGAVLVAFHESFHLCESAVDLRCTNTNDPHQVIFYVAEHVVPYEGCNAGLCSWQYIKNKFADVAQGCNLNFCAGGSDGRQVRATVWLSVVAIASTWSDFLALNPEVLDSILGASRTFPRSSRFGTRLNSGLVRTNEELLE